MTIRDSVNFGNTEVQSFAPNSPIEDQNNSVIDAAIRALYPPSLGPPIPFSPAPPTPISSPRLFSATCLFPIGTNIPNLADAMRGPTDAARSIPAPYPSLSAVPLSNSHSSSYPSFRIQPPPPSPLSLDQEMRLDIDPTRSTLTPYPTLSVVMHSHPTPTFEELAVQYLKDPQRWPTIEETTE